MSIPTRRAERWGWCPQLLGNGPPAASHTPLLGPGHRSTSQEVGPGLASVTAGSQASFPTLAAAHAVAWPESVEQTGKTREAVGLSEQWLSSVGQRACTGEARWPTEG